MSRLGPILLLLALPGTTIAQPARPKADPPADPNAPRPVLDPRGHAGEVTGVAFTPDGRFALTAAEDRTVRIWDAATGDTVRILRMPPAPAGGGLTSLALSPDGKTLATGGWVTSGRQTDGPIYLLDPDTGRLLRTLSDHVRPVTSLSFGPGGKRLASGSLDGTVRVWDPATGKAEAVLRGHAAGVFQVAFAPNGERVASVAMDMTVRLWPAGDGGAEKVLREP